MFLYGDSSPFPFEINFIDYLRDTLDVAVHLLRAERGITDQHERAEAFRQAAAVDLGRLEMLETHVAQALAGASTGAADSPAARCADAIVHSTQGHLHAAREGVRERLGRELAQVEGEIEKLQAGCARAVGTLFERHDLPEATRSTHLRSVGDRYAMRLAVHANSGLGAVLDVQFPTGHPLAHVVRAERVLERLEVQAPELSGWLQRTVRLRPHRLDRYYLTELLVQADEWTFKLRVNADGTGEGFDVRVRGVEVALQRLGEQGEAIAGAMTPTGAEATALLEFRKRVAAAVHELVGARRALLELQLDGATVAQLAHPTAVAERLVASLAPTVQEIGRRSLSPGELVLKRLVGGDRREEYFVTRADLCKRLEQVPEAARGLFAPLGLAPSAPTPALVQAPPDEGAILLSSSALQSVLLPTVYPSTPSSPAAAAPLAPHTPPNGTPFDGAPAGDPPGEPPAGAQ